MNQNISENVQMHFIWNISESMKSRLEGGYLLPKQAHTVTDYESILYQIEKHPMHVLLNVICSEINDFSCMLEPYLWRQNRFSPTTTVLKQ